MLSKFLTGPEGRAGEASVTGTAKLHSFQNCVYESRLRFSLPA